MKIFIFVVIFLSSSNALSKEFVYSGVNGSDIIISLDEESSKCNMWHKDGHVIHSTKNCGWELNKGIKIFGQGLRLEISKDNILNGNSNWTTEAGEYVVKKLKTKKYFGYEFTDLYSIEFFKEPPYSAYHLAIYSPKEGIIAFGRRTESYPNLHITNLSFISGKCGFGGECNEN